MYLAAETIYPVLRRKILRKFVGKKDENKMGINILVINDCYTVHKCCTGAEALECIAHTDLDLTISDAMLPDTDGFQICKKLERSPIIPSLC